MKQQRKQLKQAAEASAKAKAKLAQLDGELDQQRSRRATAFQRARLEEVDIPLLAPGEEPEATGGAAGGEGAAGAAGGAGGGGAAAKKRKRAAAAAAGASSSAAGAAADGGSSLLASESFSPTGGLVGTQTLEGDAGGGSGGGAAAAAAAAAAQGEAEEQVRIDFASIDARSREQLGGKGEQEALGGIEEVDRALEGMAPNMKALQQYDEVQARLHSMEGLCDTSRAAAVSMRQHEP